MRPSEKDARQAIESFLRSVGLNEYNFTLIEDGDKEWAFYLNCDDTTSYVHADLSIEWYGTTSEG